MTVGGGGGGGIGTVFKITSAGALTTSLGSVTMAGSNTISGCSSAFAPAPPGPGPVPTLSQWAMIGLTLLLAMSGVVALRARKV